MAQSAPVGFGSTSFRFDVRGAHPRSKPGGTVIAATYYTTDKQRRLGPGTHDVPVDLTARDGEKRMAKISADEWTMTAHNPKRDHQITSYQKALRAQRADEAGSLGPGTYAARSFVERSTQSPSLVVLTTTRPATQPFNESRSRGASPVKSPAVAPPTRARSVSPTYGFGRITSRLDQREMMKTSTFAGDMLQATPNVTAPGLYNPTVARAPHTKTYHSSFNSSTPRFAASHVSVEYERERLRPRTTPFN